MKQFPSTCLPVLCLFGFLGISAPTAPAQTYHWTTLAGGAGGPGSQDGSLSQPRFNHPWDVAVDALGQIYVADTLNHTIRKLTASGVVTTLAGQGGSPGATDGAGGSARLNSPMGVAVDASGNVYVADRSNHTIRKINPYGVVTTLAGLAMTTGSADGSGAAARFNTPSSVAVDASGNVYVADTTNHTIRKVTAAGAVTTLAGLAGLQGSSDGTGGAARFHAPVGVAVDATGHVYVAEEQNFAIRRITPAGEVSTLAGAAGQSGFADGTGAEARFSNVAEIAVTAGGEVYVVDAQRVRKITSAGVVTTLAGSGFTGSTDGAGAVATFHSPRGLSVDAGGQVFVADLNNHTIRKVSPAGVVSRLAGTTGSIGAEDGPQSTAKLFNPRGTAVDGSGNVYVADRGNHSIRKVSPTGVVTTVAGSAGLSGSADGTGAAARFNTPQGIAAAADGTLYVADTANHAIRKITPDGEVTTFAGLPGTSGSTNGTGSAARFNGPQGIALAGNGNLYVADSSNHTLRQITPAGAVTTLAGVALVNGVVDGAGSAARFSNPSSVTVDGAGTIYVGQNAMIRKVTPAGVVSTWVGSTSQGHQDGTGTAARFMSITGLAADSTGVLYVTDSGNEMVRRVGTDAAVTTFAGGFGGTLHPSASGHRDDIGTAARFFQPSGICLDASGHLHVAEQANHTLRRVNTADGLVSTTAGSARSIGRGSADGQTTSARFNQPEGLAVKPDGTVYVADNLNHCVRVISPEGVVSVFAGKPGPAATSADGTGTAAQFSNPRGGAVDSAGHVFIAQSRSVRRVTPAGAVTTFAGSLSSGTADGIGSAARFGENLAALAIDSAGNLFVTDTSNHTIRKITPAGAVTTLAGQGGSSGNVDGTGNAARFNSPYGVAVDGDGNVYVSDTSNHTIRKITSAGEVTTLAGSPGATGYVDGTGSAARFSSPYGMALDATGHLLVVDRNNNRIRKVSLTGEVTTLASAGQAAVGGGVFVADGTGVFPYCIAAGPGGRIYVGDLTCQRVAIGTLAPWVTRLNPATVQAGAAGLSLRVDGFGFAPGAAVLWNGSPRPTVFHSPRLLEASIPGSDLVATAGPSQSVAVRVRNLDASESGNQTFTIQNPTPPVFVIQPQSATASPGASVTLSCQVSGTGPFTYQWRKDGQTVPGIAGPTLILGSLELAQAGTYEVVASNAAGSTTSNGAVVTVAVAPVATMVPVGPAIPANGSKTLAVAAAGATPLSYQWYRGPVGDTSQPVGGNSSSFQTGELAESTTFWVRVSNAFGSTDAGPYLVVVNPPAPVITSALVATIMGGQAFSYTIQATNVPSAFAADPLPDGLSLNPVTGQIAGVPAVPGVYPIIISAGNLSGTGQAELVLTVSLPPPSITSSRSVTGRAGHPFGYQITASNSPTGFAASGLPMGLSLDTSTGLISGSPAGAGSGSFTVAAHNTGGTGSTNVSYVFSPEIEKPVIHSAAAASGVVGDAFSFQLAAINGPDSFAAAGLPAGLILNPATGLIHGTPTIAGTSVVFVSAANSAGAGPGMAMTITIAPPEGAPEITSPLIAVARKGEAFSFTITATNSPTDFAASGLPAGLNFDSASGMISGTPTVDGSFPVVLTARNASGTSRAVTMSIRISLPASVPVIASASRVQGRQGSFLQFDLLASNQPTGFFATGLPSGLALNQGSGRITGIPTSAGTATATVWAENASGTGPTLSLVFDIATPVEVPVIVLASPNATAAVGEGFTLPIPALNNPTSFTASVLPPGLGFDSSTGVIGGTPTEAGVFEITLSASNASGTSLPVVLSLTVRPPLAAPEILTDNLPRARVGQAYEATIGANGDPITAFSAEGLPPGLQMNSTSGLITGTPNVAGRYLVSIRASNEAGEGPPKILDLFVEAAGVPVITSPASWIVVNTPPQPAPPPDGQEFGPPVFSPPNSVSQYTLQATLSPTSYLALAPLPQGMTLNSQTGELRANNVAPGNYSIPLAGANGSGVGPPQLIDVTVKPPPAVPRITSGSEISVTQGRPVSVTFTATELPTQRPLPTGYGFEVQSLPAGLSFNPATGVLSGSGPSQSPSAPIRVRAFNLNGAGNWMDVSLRVRIPPQAPVISGPNWLSAFYRKSVSTTITTNSAISRGTIILTDPFGAAAGSWSSSRSISSISSISSTLASGVSNPSNNSIGISLAPPFTGRGTYSLSALGANGLTGTRTGLPITVKPKQGAPQLSLPTLVYAKRLRLFSFKLGSWRTSSFNRVQVKCINKSPSWPTLLTLASGRSGSTDSAYLFGLPLQTGTYDLTFVAENGSGPSMPATIRLIVSNPAPSRGAAEPGVEFSPPPTFIYGAVGEALEHALNVDGGIDRVEISSLPPGLRLNENTGVISGEPTFPGRYPATVTPYILNAAGEPYEVECVIAAAPGSPEITSAAEASAQVGSEFSFQLSASNGPENFNAVSLPDGLTLDGTTGLISGEPLYPGVFEIKFYAANAQGPGEMFILTLTVAGAADTPVITSAAHASGERGLPFAFNLAANPAATSFGCGALPLGLELDSATGLISGTPDESGVFPVEVWCENEAGEGTHATLNITIAPSTQVPVITTSSGVSLPGGQPFEIQLEATNTPTSFNAPFLPDWVEFDPYEGVLSGTAPAQGTFTWTFSANNDFGSGPGHLLNLTVGEEPSILDQWRELHFGSATLNIGNLDDFDGDGVGNLVEFAAGTNPADAGAGTAPLRYVGDPVPGGGLLESTGQPLVLPAAGSAPARVLFVRRKDRVLAGLVYGPEFSDDLERWEPDDNEPVILAEDGDYELVTLPIPAWIVEQTSGFFRLRLTVAPPSQP